MDRRPTKRERRRRHRSERFLYRHHLFNVTVAGLTTISTVTLDITGALSILGAETSDLAGPIDNSGTLQLLDGAAVTTGSLTNNNDLLVDPSDYNGGSDLMVDDTLTNSGTLQIGNSYLTSPTMVTVAGLDNTGWIF